eukprot:CAMPEP_0177639792 /NCGR_PEP_ID=MMETSP0447-20121125/6207_1 /TAXON_ID=0 /ORGANISM="Stygamoeba regulata, Strain BSH-02190019" /LENGTH=280 /DNA_ID=CAMNT_0019141837 /DNA_START=149 /DNA_END=991 /DNA_ORIENTATION=-
MSAPAAQAKPVFKLIGGASLHPDQVAGHGDIMEGDGLIYKPSNGLEPAFYQSLAVHAPEGFREFTPKFYGMFKRAPYTKDTYVGMENLTHKYVHPCVLDLKIGTRQHMDSFTPEKIAVCLEKCCKSTSLSTGVRVCGMKVYRPHKDAFLSLNKDAGKLLREEHLPSVLDAFLSDGEVRLHRLAQFFCERIKALREIMATQHTYNLISTSLLLVYDADLPGESGDHQMLAACKTIDFANATLQKDDGHEIDTGYVKGLDSLLSYFEALADPNFKPIDLPLK